MFKGYLDLQSRAPFQMAIIIYQNSALILYRPEAHRRDPKLLLCMFHHKLEKKIISNHLSEKAL
jgi:hypothetical protein